VVFPRNDAANRCEPHRSALVAKERPDGEERSLGRIRSHVCPLRTQERMQVQTLGVVQRQLHSICPFGALRVRVEEDVACGGSSRVLDLQHSGPSGGIRGAISSARR
jgi:hypothetical protein